MNLSIQADLRYSESLHINANSKKLSIKGRARHQGTKGAGRLVSIETLVLVDICYLFLRHLNARSESRGFEEPGD